MVYASAAQAALADKSDRQENILLQEHKIYSKVGSFYCREKSKFKIRWYNYYCRASKKCDGEGWEKMDLTRWWHLAFGNLTSQFVKLAEYANHVSCNIKCL